MMETITIMVLPPKNESLPQFLVEKNGMWCLWKKEGSIADLEFARKTVDADLRKVINKVLAGEQATKTWYRMKQLGTKLYNALLPKLLQDHLRAVPSSDEDPALLCIHSFAGWDWIPWDLMWDTEAFLGRRFQIARLPVGTASHHRTEKQPHLVERVYNMLGEGVLAEPEAEIKWQDTFALLPSAVTEERWPGNGHAYALPEDCLIHINATDTKPDIMHFTCQGGVEDGRVYWAFKKPFLDFDECISTDELDLIGADIDQSHPLIFGNACASATITQDEAISDWGIVTNFGRRCLSLGAVAFVGTLARVTEELAVDFAPRFYEQLLDKKKSVARALWNVKREYDDNGGSDPSWLFYCLYGDPGTKFETS
jgi:hypothetical protein